jgi:hypothetical protein
MNHVLRTANATITSFCVKKTIEYQKNFEVNDKPLVRIDNYYYAASSDEGRMV